ncbi:MAG: RHS repeat-associated core domain-containing protein, partial [Planctomycetaceae bacterium]
QTNSQFQPWFAYTGREWDPAAGLYFYRARWYDPRAGRFLSEDPLGFAAGDVNLNRYVGNGATLWVDPSGETLFTPGLGVGAGAVAGAVTGAVTSGIVYTGMGLLGHGFTLGGLAGSVSGGAVAGAVTGAVVAGTATADPTTVLVLGGVAAVAGGAAGGATGSAVRQLIDKRDRPLIDRVNGKEVGYEAVIGGLAGLLGFGIGRGLGGSLGNGSLSIPTGMAPAVNFNGTLNYVLTHTDIQQKPIVMAGVIAAANQLTAQAARGLAMAVNGGPGGTDPATDMASRESQTAGAMTGREPISPFNYPKPDPDMSIPPVRYEPQSIAEVIRMRMGKGPTTKATHGTGNIEAHHRQQIPITNGGVIDEVQMKIHRGCGYHGRHTEPSQLTPAQRAREIREHWLQRSGEYILPGGEGI